MSQEDGIKTTREMIDAQKSIKVRHKKGTSGFKPTEYDSWIEFWHSKNPNKQLPTACPCCKKETKSAGYVGAHVVSNGEKTYICPTCDSCNSTYGEGKDKSKEFTVFRHMLAEFSEEEVSTR